MNRLRGGFFVPVIQAITKTGVRMKMQFRLVSKRWKLDVDINFLRIALAVALLKADADQVVQFIAPFFS